MQYLKPCSNINKFLSCRFILTLTLNTLFTHADKTCKSLFHIESQKVLEPYALNLGASYRYTRWHYNKAIYIAVHESAT